MIFLDIAEVTARSGFPPSTLRYYEEKGLITSAGRNGLRRFYDTGVLTRLALISLGRNAGFSLDEIAPMLGDDDKASIDRDNLNQKADELDRTIRRLKALSAGLRHVASCPAPSHNDCPTFKRLMRVATADTTRKAKQQR